MKVDEVLVQLSTMFRAFNAEQMESWAPAFHDGLGRFEGYRLKEAHVAVLKQFKPSGRTPHPIVSDYTANLPVDDPQAKGGGAKLDWQDHGRLVRQIMADWRRRQGERAANGVPQVLRALELIAEPLANVMAWSGNDNRLLLTAAELRIAKQRAISQERYARHGALRAASAKAEVWWPQICAIQEAWGIGFAWDDWHTERRADQAQPIEPSQLEFQS